MTNRRPFAFNPQLGTAIMKTRYAAGLFDGEGCISVGKFKRGFSLMVGMTNTDPRLTEWMYENFGGGVLATPPAGNRHAVFFWSLHGIEAKRFLDIISPFLIGKREHSELVKTIPVRMGQLLIQVEHYRQMKCLNKREHLVFSSLSPWIHAGRKSRDHKRIALATRAKKRCPTCRSLFGIHQRESVKEFWLRLYCSHKCWARAKSGWFGRDRLNEEQGLASRGITRDGH